MLRSERRVVITGLGIITPVGIGPEAYWSSLSQGRGGVRRINAFEVGDLPNDIGGEVAEFDSKSWFKSFALPEHRKTLSKSQKYMARDIQLAVAAAELAMVDAGLANGGVEPTRLGVDLGAGLISSELDELAPAINSASEAAGTFDYHAWGREGIPQIPPTWLLKYLPNMLACHISILLNCQGPSNTITEAEASSNLAIGEAARIIARGRADVMISGGADSKIHPLSLIRMCLLDQMSRWRGDPSGACKPFDRRRDGWVPGEGAGILILEEREHALGRGRGAMARCSASVRAATPTPVAGSTPRERGPRSPSWRRCATRASSPGRSATSTRTATQRSCPTWPSRGRSNASSGPGARSPSRR